jgi:aspartate/methionine/tyrosine aminotransferase
LKPLDSRLIRWILESRDESKFNFANSGLSEPELGAMGVDTDYSHYLKVQGHVEADFREEVAELHRVEADEVVPTNGGSEAIFLAFTALARHERAVVPVPNYEALFRVPQALGFEVSHSLKGASEGAVAALSDPNNPTGRTQDEQVKTFLESSRRLGFTVYVNETYKEFEFHHSFKTSFDSRYPMAVSGTMTKFYGLGSLRVGWMVTRKSMAERLRRVKSLTSPDVPLYSLWISRQVLGKRRKFIERAKRIRDRSYKLARKFVKDTPEITWSNPDSAPFGLVYYEKGPDSVTLVKRLLTAGILVSPGKFFGTEKCFRLCLTSEEPSIEDGLKLLSETLHRELR